MEMMRSWKGGSDDYTLYTLLRFKLIRDYPRFINPCNNQPCRIQHHGATNSQEVYGWLTMIFGENYNITIGRFFKIG